VISRATRAAVALLCATAVAVLPAAPAQADQIRDNQWHLRYLKISEAHKISQGEGVTVAVIDTGVDPHPDLRNNLLPGTVTYAGGSGDGRQDGDSGGHGTGMAGLIAAHGRGKSGVLGIAPKAKILPIRDSIRKNSGKSADTVAGIHWAISQNADVINISGAMPPSIELQEAIDEAFDADIVVVAAAGNRPGDFLVQYPAAIDGVVAVGSVDRRGNHSDNSVTGDKLVIAAPGVDIVSTTKGGKYSKSNGTSNATAIVSGAVALIRSRYPDMSAKEVVHRLTATAVDKGAPGRDEEYGYGVLDVVAALTADVPPLADDTTPRATPAPSPTTTEADNDGNAAPQPDDTGNLVATVALVGCSALVVLGLLATLLTVMLIRRRRTTPRPPYR